MKLLLLLLFFICMLYFRYILICIICNFPIVCKYVFSDFINYFKFKKYNVFNGFGRIVLYSGCGSQVFGSGKTCSMIKEVLSIYNKYNGLPVWSDDEEKFVFQHVHIISNVELYDVPYIKFEGVNQFIDLDKYNFPDQDVTLYLLDESGSIFNSREFRNNISTEFLRTLLQSRKNKVALYMTSQRLQFTDKILREICSVVVECRKTWRFIRCREFNALDLEYAVNPEIVRPRLIRYWFATDQDFKSYNSYQLVEQLKKNYNPDDFLTTSEILETYGQTSADLDVVGSGVKKRFRSKKNYK